MSGTVRNESIARLRGFRARVQGLIVHDVKVADEDIAELLVAGGFGNYVNMESAVRIALLPPLPLDKFTYVGNAAHIGAELALLSENERLKANDIANNIEHVALATRMEYQELFVEACNFGSA